jgi:hypothetical protein
MNSNKFFILVLALFVYSTAIYADNSTSKRFYGGVILRAEIRPDNPDAPIVILNVNEFKPKSKVLTNLGYAIITVNMDSGRSLGLYDYTLIDGNKEFPIVAFLNKNREYDAGEWVIKKTKSNKKYSMLFKMPLLSTKNQTYKLRFKLLKNKVKDLPIKFINLKSNPFTSLKKIPAEGMVGVDPHKPKPVVALPSIPTDKKAKETPSGEKKSAKLIAADAKKAADLAAFIGAGDNKETPKKTTPNKEKKSTKKKDSWDDWE